MTKTGTFNHISLSVSDFEQGKKFYNFLLVDLLGYKHVMDDPYWNMWSLSTGEAITISPGNKTPHHKSNPGLNHFAFNAETHALIDEFYQKIVQFQESNKSMTACTILDKPALYPEYSEGYYAVFFTDPDGIKLEIAYTPQMH